jgi:hypothetical protein
VPNLSLLYPGFLSPEASLISMMANLVVYVYCAGIATVFGLKPGGLDKLIVETQVDKAEFSAS